MDEQPALPTPPILPQAATPPNYGTVHEPQVTPSAVQPPVPPSHPKKVPPLLIVGAVLFVIIFGSLLFASQRKPAVTATPTPTPAVSTPTPTSTRALTSFATQSAFIQFESSVDAFPGIIQGAAIQDPTIVPPVLDLPLGF
jgi:hypothetical protein